MHYIYLIIYGLIAGFYRTSNAASISTNIEEAINRSPETTLQNGAENTRESQADLEMINKTSRDTYEINGTVDNKNKEEYLKGVSPLVNKFSFNNEPTLSDTPSADKSFFTENQEQFDKELNQSVSTFESGIDSLQETDNSTTDCTNIINYAIEEIIPLIKSENLTGDDNKGIGNKTVTNIENTSIMDMEKIVYGYLQELLICTSDNISFSKTIDLPVLDFLDNLLYVLKIDKNQGTTDKTPLTP